MSQKLTELQKCIEWNYAHSNCAAIPVNRKGMTYTLFNDKDFLTDGLAHLENGRAVIRCIHAISKRPETIPVDEIEV